MGFLVLHSYPILDVVARVMVIRQRVHPSLPSLLFEYVDLSYEFGQVSFL